MMVLDEKSGDHQSWNNSSDRLTTTLQPWGQKETTVDIFRNTYLYTVVQETILHCDMCLLPTNPSLLVYVLHHRYSSALFRQNKSVVLGQRNHHPVWEHYTTVLHFVLKHNDKEDY